MATNGMGFVEARYENSVSDAVALALANRNSAAAAQATADAALAAANLALLEISGLPAGFPDFEQKYLARGVVKAGFDPLKPGQFSHKFTDFIGVGDFVKAAGIASAAAIGPVAGGAIEIDAGAGDEVDYKLGSTGCFPSILISHGNFYLAARIQVGAGSAVDGAMIVGAGGANDKDHVGMGVYGNHFAFVIGDAAGPTTELVNSTVAVDNDWHTLEGWCAGGDYLFSVDDEAPVHLVPAVPPTEYMFGFISAAGGAAGAFSARFDSALWVYPYAS